MPDILIFADSIRSPEMRHEVPVAVPDAFLFVQRGERRSVVCSAFEMQRINEADPAIETAAPEKFGVDELLAGGLTRAEADLEVYARACRDFGVTSAVVPATFPVELADHLRAEGIEIESDRELFELRRRRKTDAEIAGLTRAQRACEAALDAARDLLRRAGVVDGAVVLDGEPLTSERIKRDVEQVFSAHDVVADDFIVSHGAQTAIGHHAGSGAILAGEPIVFDLFPRDRASVVHTDMTRTYVVGDISDELREYHRLTHEALRRATEGAKPGANGRDLMAMVCHFFAEHGYPTQLTKAPEEVLDSGFFHSLGHGVGLEVHERPWIGRAGDDLVPGDVIALEPGLYRAGYGGVRLEDVLLVTDGGVEVVTQYPYELAP